jgi:hypothetical protein
MSGEGRPAEAEKRLRLGIGVVAAVIHGGLLGLVLIAGGLFLALFMANDTWLAGSEAPWCPGCSHGDGSVDMRVVTAMNGFLGLPALAGLPLAGLLVGLGWRRAWLPAAVAYMLTSGLLVGIAVLGCPWLLGEASYLLWYHLLLPSLLGLLMASARWLPDQALAALMRLPFALGVAGATVLGLAWMVFLVVQELMVWVMPGV